jgi:pimeloyl-ACP methyl ester carboxylesterase
MLNFLPRNMRNMQNLSHCFNQLFVRVFRVVRGLKSGILFWPFFAILFLGSLFWAHSRDPFRRTEFAVKTAAGTKVHGITVLPRRLDRSLALPTVVYVHGSGGTWLTDGNDLRQFAELGMAAVGFDYDQTNSGAFDGEFSAVLDYVRRQSWADANAIAWVGFSLGAQNTLSYLLKHPENHPQLYVRLAGGWIPELDVVTARREPRPTVLLVHGENDQIFPVGDAKRLAELLRTNGTDVMLHIMAGHGHDFESDQPVVFRLIAEYCKATLTPGHPLPEFPRLHPYPFLFCISPAFAWLGFWLYWRKNRRDSAGGTPTGATATVALPLTKFEVGLRVTASVLATLAVADTALHLIPPRMEVSGHTLSIARRFLLAPKWHRDFETLATLPVWQGQRLQTLLEHVNLANYTVNELVNWKVNDALYREFVLSPVVVSGGHELNWRRALWENFYPRVRHENTTSDAAVIVVRFLRQRVTIAPNHPKQPGVESMWNGHIVNLEDFEILCTAALRSVGVPARLNGKQEAEFWTGSQWKAAPRPLGTTWVEGKAKVLF